jgi:hypothetical protein
MLAFEPGMNQSQRTDSFHGLFELRTTTHGQRHLASRTAPPATIPDPHTGRPLKVASLEVSERCVCPACSQPGAGGYVTFVSDLRLAFACPSCEKLVWLAGA